MSVSEIKRHSWLGNHGPWVLAADHDAEVERIREDRDNLKNTAESNMLDRNRMALMAESLRAVNRELVEVAERARGLIAGGSLAEYYPWADLIRALDAAIEKGAKG